MKFTKTLQLVQTVLVGSLVHLSVNAGQAQSFTLDLVESGDDPINQLLNGLLKPGDNGITVTGNETFVGRIGDGIDPNTAQSALYQNLNLVPNNPGLPTISNVDGILLTSGTANLPTTNTDPAFTSVTGTGGDADLSNLFTPSNITNDVNFLEFEFQVAPGNNAVSAQFVFASEEFPDQSVTDVFGFFVDGVNFAFFPPNPNDLISFSSVSNFDNNDFGTGNYDIEYDGLTQTLNVVGLLDPNLTTHTLKIAIADTSDDIFDSGVFIGGLMATNSDQGGIIETTPEPTTILSLLGLAGLGATSAIKRKLNR